MWPFPVINGLFFVLLPLLFINIAGCGDNAKLSLLFWSWQTQQHVFLFIQFVYVLSNCTTAGLRYMFAEFLL